MLNLLPVPSQLFQPKNHVHPPGVVKSGVPSLEMKTMSKSPELAVKGIWTLCVVESVGNDVGVTDCTVAVEVAVSTVSTPAGPSHFVNSPDASQLLVERSLHTVYWIS